MKRLFPPCEALCSLVDLRKVKLMAIYFDNNTLAIMALRIRSLPTICIELFLTVTSQEVELLPYILLNVQQCVL